MGLDARKSWVSTRENLSSGFANVGPDLDPYFITDSVPEEFFLKVD